LFDDSRDTPRDWEEDRPLPVPYRDFWILLCAILVGFVFNVGVVTVLFRWAELLRPMTVVLFTLVGLVLALAGLAPSWAERRNGPSLARVGILLGVVELLGIVAGLLRVLTAHD
jgi:hypothetical protein